MHEPCGAEVVMVPVQFVPEATTAGMWPVPVPFERLLRATPAGGLGLVQHHCRDYRAWYEPADTDDIDSRDVAGGWQPARATEVALAA